MQELVDLSTRHQLADAAAQAQLLRDLLTVATERQEILAALIEDDPGEVLRLALPADLRASLPAAVQALVEEEMEVEGELDQVRRCLPSHVAVDELLRSFLAYRVSGTPTFVLADAAGKVQSISSGYRLNVGLQLAGWSWAQRPPAPAQESRP